MNKLLAQQLDEVLGDAAFSARSLACEGQLRAAAGTVSRGAADVIRATTVVGTLAADDRRQLDTLVADIAAEHGLDASVTHQTVAFSVRFTRRPVPA